MLRKQLVTLSFIALSAAGCAAVAAQTQSTGAELRSALKQELEVMNSIFETKLAQNQAAGEERSRIFGMQRFNFNYLAGQGVVYYVNFGGPFGFDLELPLPPGAPMPDVMIEKRIIKNGVEEVETNYHHMVTNGLAVGDVTRDIHEKRRQIRDLEFAKNAADGTGRQEMEKELTVAKQELELMRSKLDEQKQQLQAAAADFKDKQQQRREARRAQLEKQVSAFERTLAETLCTYGATLKSLPNDEHISFVLKGSAIDDTGTRDKVYIFDKASLMTCQKNNKASDLLSQSLTYSF